MTFQPFELIEGDWSCGLVLLCDHARNSLPANYGTLGLKAADFERHIAYDIGAEALTRELAQRLGAPAIHSCFSRLLIDPNRGEDDPTIIMRLSDGSVIPGNHPITSEETATRIAAFHAPYHHAIDTALERACETGNAPLVFSVHSFTPVWRGVERPWHAAFLWDNDPRLSRFMIDELCRDPDLVIGDNEPYDGALRNDTMYRHATLSGLAHSLLEVRQDLIADEAGVRKWADRLTPLLDAANQRADMHEIKHYGSRTDGTAIKRDGT